MKTSSFLLGYYIVLGILGIYIFSFLLFFFWHAQSSNTHDASQNMSLSEAASYDTQYSNSSILISYLGKPLSVLAILHREYLFIPTSNILLTIFYCSITTQENEPVIIVDQCQNEIHMFYMGLSSIMLFFSLLLALASSVFYNDTQPDSAIPWANCSTAVVLLKLVKKIIIICCFVLSFKVKHLVNFIDSWVEFNYANLVEYYR